MNPGIPVRSIEADAATIGPATRLFYAEADALGCVRYRVENRGARTVSFGREYAEGLWAVFDQIVNVAFFRPPATRLRAFGSFVTDKPVVFMLGSEWGDVLRDGAEAVRSADPMRDFRGIMPPIHYGDRGEWLTLRFTMNAHYREIFSREVRRLMDPDMINIMEIYFEIPSGEYVESLLLLQDKKSVRIKKRFPIEAFPLVWPDSDLLSAKGDHAGKTGGVFTGSDRDFETPPPIPPAPRAARPPRRPVAPAPAAPRREPRPPSTLHLSEKELIETIRAESDESLRWTLIENNLALCSAGRTYSLLCNFGDLIGEKTAAWPLARLVLIFGKQPGHVLAPISRAWPVDVMLALADENPEKEFLMEWLSERETERLLSLDPSAPVAGPAEAREWLGLSRQGAVSKETVKRVWRRLLGFLKSDYGRSRERAVHQKKDEIAKRIHQARDILIRK